MTTVIIADGYLWAADPSASSPGMPIEGAIEKLRALEAAAGTPVPSYIAVTYLPKDSKRAIQVLNNWFAEFLPECELHVGYDFPRWDRLITGVTEVK